MKKTKILEKKLQLIGSIIISLASIAIFFRAYLWSDLEYTEQTKFKQIVNAKIINYKVVGSMTSTTTTHIYKVELLNNLTIDDTIIKNSNFSILDTGGFANHLNRDHFLSENRIGDTVKIQLTAKTSARLLQWKEWKANEPASFKTKIWSYLGIFILYMLFLIINIRTIKLIINFLNKKE